MSLMLFRRLYKCRVYMCLYLIAQRFVECIINGLNLTRRSDRFDDFIFIEYIGTFKYERRVRMSVRARVHYGRKEVLFEKEPMLHRYRFL